MNKKRRKEINDSLEVITSEVEKIGNCIEDEQIAYDNLPESLQMSEKGETMGECINILTDECENIISAIDNMMSAIE